MSQAEAGRPWFGAELTDGEGGEFLQATYEALHDARLTPELPVVGGDAFRLILTKGLEPSLTGKATATEALTAIQKEWQQRVDTTGKDVIRASYRRQLGLTAIRPTAPEPPAR